MGTLDSQVLRYAHWENVWQAHLADIDEQIIDYYDNSCTVPTASELSGRLRDWFETLALNEAQQADFVMVCKDPRYLHAKVRQRVSQLHQAGLVSAGFLRHIAATETGIGAYDTYWSVDSSSLGFGLGTHSGAGAASHKAQRPGQNAAPNNSNRIKELSVHLQLLESKYPRLMRAWEDSLTEIDREIEEVYRYTEDTPELAIDECKTRIEYLLECLPLDIQAHFELAGLRHDSFLLRAKVEQRISYLADQGRIRIPRSIANHFSPH